MASFQHYCVFDESMEILRDLVERYQLVVIPEQPVLPEPHLARFDRFVPAIVDALGSYRVLYLEGAFTTSPLEFERRNSGTAAGTYYARDGGSRLRWILPSVTPEARVTPGSIGGASRS